MTRLRERVRELLEESNHESSTTSHGCPGRADCSRLDAVQLCKGCEFEKDSWGKWPASLDWSQVTDEAKRKYTNHEPRTPNHGELASTDRWISHLFWLYHKKEAGCVFHLNDLTPREWEGLEIVVEEVNRITPKF